MDFDEDFEEGPPWSVRLLWFLLSSFLTVGAVLVMIAVALLGWGFVAVGLVAPGSHAALGWIMFLFGVGIWLRMIFAGLNAYSAQKVAAVEPAMM